MIIAEQLEAFGSDNYQPPEMLFAAISAGATVTAALLWRWDQLNGEPLWYDSADAALTLALSSPSSRHPHLLDPRLQGRHHRAADHAAAHASLWTHDSRQRRGRTGKAVT